MNKLTAVKYAAQLVVGSSTTAVVSNLIKQNVTPKNTLQKVEFVIGAFAVGSVAAAQSEQWITATIDQGVSSWQKAKQKTS